MCILDAVNMTMLILAEGKMLFLHSEGYDLKLKLSKSVGEAPTRRFVCTPGSFIDSQVVHVGILFCHRILLNRRHWQIAVPILALVGVGVTSSICTIIQLSISLEVFESHFLAPNLLGELFTLFEVMYKLGIVSA